MTTWGVISDRVGTSVAGQASHLSLKSDEQPLNTARRP
jgi:hypothetical protein